MNRSTTAAIPPSGRAGLTVRAWLVPLALMLLAGVALWLSLYLLHSLFLCFFLYYLVICLAAPLTDLWLGGKRSLREIARCIGLVPLRGKRALSGLLVGLGMTAVMVLAFILLRGLFFADNRILASVESWGVPARNVVLVFIVMLLFNGATEELFWRGYLYGKFKPLRHRALAVGLPASFFCIQHFFVIASIITQPLAILLAMTGIGLAGLIWGLMRELHSGLLACMLGHMVVTAGYLIVFYFFIVR